jgi:hypothetical protein
VIIGEDDDAQQSLQEVEIVLCLPDGQVCAPALESAIVWRDAAGRDTIREAFVIKAGRWSGSVRLEPVALRQQSASENEEGVEIPPPPPVDVKGGIE